jgi:YfiH family protein
VTPVERGGLRFLTFERLEQAGLLCVLSTRPIDVRAEADRARLFEALGVDPGRVATVRQVHHAAIAVADPADVPQADGLVTNEPGLALFLRAADCSLIVVADPEHRAVGVAHAGWKGSARGVVVKLVSMLHKTYGSVPSRCLAAVGPTIGVDRFEVGPEVPAKFLKRGDWTREYVTVRGKRLHFDLLNANARFLRECGIPEEAIDVCDQCTYDSPELLHSFRRAGTGSGHHGIVAMWA